ncbi:cell division protein FtsL [Candidatus Babeliales bacterium]|nr:cell division protein FtsL [Candidatus Babeliales bacterium]
MTRRKFFATLFITTLIFIFIKIYQHNLLIKLSYQKQRSENKKNLLKRHKNKLLVKLSKLKNYGKIKKMAQEKFGMVALKPSQIITVSKNKIKKIKYD